MRWIALHLPQLSLESFAASLTMGVVLGEAGRAEPALALLNHHRIGSLNGVARAAGVRPGMKRATALALAPDIVLGQADPDRDHQALTAVAHAALAFTPLVTMPPPGRLDAGQATVLLEVAPSLRFFGGMDALLQRLRAATATFGHELCIASAPTAQGAALLAWRRGSARRAVPNGSSDELHCADLACLHRALEAAPAWLPQSARQHREALQAMGLRTLGDLLRLPRAGLARRFGAALIDEIDRAFGRQPDPREPIVLPPVFESRLELAMRADTADQLLRGAGVLLARLAAWLAAGHAQVRRFELQLLHEKRARGAAPGDALTSLEIALAEPSRDPAHLLMLLGERLARLELPAPTLDLRLLAADITRRAAPNQELFPTAGSRREGLVRLIERLQARLGHEHIQRLVAVEDHRPELATEMVPLDLSGTPTSQAPRREPPADTGRRSGSLHPVWLLPQAEPLAERASGPLLEGQPLQLLSGPERVEAGWWDARVALRDYFIAQTPTGALVWIYRSRLPFNAEASGGWFLQGRFG